MAVRIMHVVQMLYIHKSLKESAILKLAHYDTKCMRYSGENSVIYATLYHRKSSIRFPSDERSLCFYVHAVAKGLQVTSPQYSTYLRKQKHGRVHGPTSDDILIIRTVVKKIKYSFLFTV
jgi:hypothetical protein